MKATEQRYQRVLEQLARQPGNDVCADCRDYAPRWASWNLGVFLCVNCAAVHRKLGTHVSKVKSVTLDTWTKEQVESMKEKGNIKVNAQSNPDERRNPPPTNNSGEERDSEMEKYIRSKYQYKDFQRAFAAMDALPPLDFAESYNSSSSSRERPSKPSKLSSTPPRSSSFRDSIVTSSSQASVLLDSMGSHSRSLSRNSQGRASSRSPSARTTTFPSSAKDPTDMSFTSVGVSPNDSAKYSRPSTSPAASTPRPISTASVPASASIPKITTTAPTASTQPKAVAAPPTLAPAITAQAQPPPQPAPPAQPPKPKSELWEDILSLEIGPTTNVQPTVVGNLPMSTSMLSTFNNVPQPAFSQNTGMGSAMFSPTSVPSLTTGSTISSTASFGSTMGMGMGMTSPLGVHNVAAPNPFMGMMLQQQTTQYGQNQAPTLQSPFPSVGIQSISPAPSPSPFIVQPTALQASAQPSSMNPFGVTSVSPAPFIQTTGSPFQPQQQQQLQFTQQAAQFNSTSVSPFATFAQGMLPQQQLQQQNTMMQMSQPSAVNPFGQMMMANTGAGMGGFGVQQQPMATGMGNMFVPNQQQVQFGQMGMNGVWTG